MHLSRIAFAMAVLMLVGVPARSEEKGLAGTTVRLGPYLGEVLVWETGLDLTVYDDSGATVPPRDISAVVEVTRFNGKARNLVARFGPRDTYVRADLDLLGAQKLEATLRVATRGAKYTGTVAWRLADDRARRGLPR